MKKTKMARDLIPGDTVIEPGGKLHRVVEAKYLEALVSIPDFGTARAFKVEFDDMGRVFHPKERLRVA